MFGHVRRLVRLLTNRQTPTGVTFASFLYETKETREVQHITVIVGASTANVYQKDVEFLNALIPTLKGVDRDVAQELLDSRMESLRKGVGNNSQYTQADTWWIPKLLKGSGIRVHRQNGSFQIVALLHKKDVVVPGTYKPDTRRPRTVAKDAIRRQLPSHRIRTYCLDNVAGVRMNGETIEFDNVITVK
jgi:hypothetical protein